MFSHVASSAYTVPFPFSFFLSLPELLRRHAARLRRFLSSPDPDAAFKACRKYLISELNAEKRNDQA